MGEWVTLFVALYFSVLLMSGFITENSGRALLGAVVASAAWATYFVCFK